MVAQANRATRRHTRQLVGRETQTDDWVTDKNYIRDPAGNITKIADTRGRPHPRHSVLHPRLPTSDDRKPGHPTPTAAPPLRLWVRWADQPPIGAVTLPSRHTAVVVPALVDTYAGLDPRLCATLTWDRGMELAGHKGFTAATSVDMFFAAPRSPWQCGTTRTPTSC